MHFAAVRIRLGTKALWCWPASWMRWKMSILQCHELEINHSRISKYDNMLYIIWSWDNTMYTDIYIISKSRIRMTRLNQSPQSGYMIHNNQWQSIAIFHIPQQFYSWFTTILNIIGSGHRKHLVLWILTDRCTELPKWRQAYSCWLVCYPVTQKSQERVKQWWNIATNSTCRGLQQK